jgi:hypothetical protein
MFNFDRKPPVKCIHCGKDKGMHLAQTLNCPVGMKTRIGYTSFGETVFAPKAVSLAAREAP